MGRHENGQTVIVLPGSAPTKGRLLVATPPLDDPNFDRTVIFVLDELRRRKIIRRQVTTSGATISTLHGQVCRR